MSCDRYRGAIAEAAAGAESAPVLGAHLEQCEACRTELEARREALTLADAELAGLLASEASPGLPARIRRAVAADERPGWWPLRARPALAVAAALAVALAAFATWRTASRPLSPEALQQTRVTPVPSGPPPRDGQLAPRQETTATARSAGQAGGRPPSRPLPVPERPPGSELSPVPSVGPLAPEVLVPPGQEEALLRFAAELEGRTVTPDSLLVAERSAPLNEPRPLYRVEIEMLTLGSSVASGL